MADPAISIRDITGMPVGDLVESMTGYSVFDLFRCDHVESGVRCEALALVELGNPSKAQVCEDCAKAPAYKRFRVRTAMDYSDETVQEFYKARLRAIEPSDRRRG